MILFAQEKDWVSLVQVFGWPGAIVVILLALLWRHGPKLIDAQVLLTNTATEHIKSNAESQRRTAEALEAIAGSVNNKMDAIGDRRYHDHIFSTVRTNEILHHVAEMVVAVAEAANPKAGEESRKHLYEIEETLESHRRLRSS